jgi:branched-chain amino acid transport system substrate-binding protein
MLLDLSKTLSDQGTRAKDVSVLAMNDINSLLTGGGCNLKFATSIDDYQLDNNLALTDLKALAASGVQVVVGPLNSGTAQYILSYADSNHVVLISPSSTSPALATSNDYLYRTVPNDAAQGLADARMMYASPNNARDLIIVQRHDTYGDGLANATRDRFTALGGTVEPIIQYDATAADAGTLDWTATLTTLNSEFNSAVTAGHAAGTIAIDVIAFEEFSAMVIKAQSSFSSGSTHNFPWSTLPWFGTDGEADNGHIITPTSTGNIVAQVKIVSTLFSTTNNTKSNALYSLFGSKYPGTTCDSYCLGAYDDLWLGAMSTILVGSNNGTAIQAYLENYIKNSNGSLYGVTGPLSFQASGDRLPTSYQIWKVVLVSGTPTWQQAGSWDNASDSVTWTNPP